MPTRAWKSCSFPNCGAILRQGGRCAAHARPAWGGKARPSRQARGYGAEYERNRRIVLMEETHCRLCGGPGLPDDQADHIIRPTEGGTSERENLRRAHRECNLKRGSASGAKRRGLKVFA